MPVIWPIFHEWSLFAKTLSDRSLFTFNAADSLNDAPEGIPKWRWIERLADIVGVNVTSPLTEIPPPRPFLLVLV